MPYSVIWQGLHTVKRASHIKASRVFAQGLGQATSTLEWVTCSNAMNNYHLYLWYLCVPIFHINDTGNVRTCCEP